MHKQYFFVFVFDLHLGVFYNYFFNFYCFLLPTVNKVVHIGTLMDAKKTTNYAHLF